MNGPVHVANPKFNPVNVRLRNGEGEEITVTDKRLDVNSKDVDSQDSMELQLQTLKELKKINLHLSILTDNVINNEGI